MMHDDQNDADRGVERRHLGLEPSSLFASGKSEASLSNAMPMTLAPMATEYQRRRATREMYPTNDRGKSVACTRRTHDSPAPGRPADAQPPGACLAAIHRIVIAIPCTAIPIDEYRRRVLRGILAIIAWRTPGELAVVFAYVVNRVSP